LIGDLARRRYQAAERYFSTLGLNHTEARLLTLLQQAGGETTQDALSNLLYLDRSNAGRALKSLEQQGYVERYTHAADKRTRLVQITAEGRNVAADIAHLKHQMVERFFGDLQDEEAGEIVDLLRKAYADENHI
jgi:MarR family transcriptional regulator for hemolysin